MKTSKVTFDPCRIWPGRVPTENTKARPIGNAGSIAGCYDPVSRTAFIPIIDRAYDRTVRVHESLHALYSPLGACDARVVTQAIEDMRLHATLAELTSGPRRDELAMAAYDLRTVCKLPPSVPERIGGNSDIALVMFARVMAIYAGGAKPRINILPRVMAGRALEYARNQAARLGYTLDKIIGAAITELQRGDYPESSQRAIEIMSPLFFAPPAPKPGEPKPGEPKPAPKPGEPKPAPKPAPKPGEPKPGEPPKIDTFKPRGPKPAKKPAISQGDAGKPAIFQADLDQQVQPKKADGELDIASSSLLTPDDVKALELHKKKRGYNDFPPKMTIIPLHGLYTKRSVEGRGDRLAYSGTRINVNRLVQSMASPVPCRVMITSGITPQGGTLLIDASMSMEITDELLQEVISRAPMATIAYFSGNGAGTGKLVIYADHGRVYGGPQVKANYGGMPFRESGNDVDLPAMQWLLKQQAPRAFVGDLEACGPAEIYNRLAVRLTRAAEKKHLIKLFGSVRDYLDYLNTRPRK